MMTFYRHNNGQKTAVEVIDRKNGWDTVKTLFDGATYPKGVILIVPQKMVVAEKQVKIDKSFRLPVETISRLKQLDNASAAISEALQEQSKVSLSTLIKTMQDVPGGKKQVYNCKLDIQVVDGLKRLAEKMGVAHSALGRAMIWRAIGDCP